MEPMTADSADSDGTLRMPFDLDADRRARLRAADQEPDEHRAFHVRSGMPFPDPHGLCVRCANEAINAAMEQPRACDHCREMYDEASGDGYCGLCPNCADKGVEPHA